ncbi:MAG: hypothetical protein COY72_00900 [Candidatus Nealsonbacteria bacterium CG_4_10_14_0_8_um_filter_35_10]|uniref:Uncharacterized protein n=2 Tax=Candidatus Nealsoniibacteriota TaxID=1817911 RepID=A0A2M7R8J3_9BACT|nr:MAG: hypothetical protein COY72_00900 [Candidatus Nealsonbacteria bacterium CG_4_10_14_0_8_um_filter_35_10]PJB99533.1 MAG: hypothetical protein CO077_01220 [Candidatus Nealsonbacteria bacterium CG_4_9_14_0_8_um_filter_35_12]
MAEIYIQRNILVSYLSWYFSDVPREILKGWKNFLVFNLNYFSIPLLLKTFFSHWRQYKWDYGRGFDLKRYAEAFFSNLISRILGAMVRSILIFIGIFCEILILIFGLIFFFGWLILPVLLIWGLFFGIKLLL